MKIKQLSECVALSSLSVLLLKVYRIMRPIQGLLKADYNVVQKNEAFNENEHVRH